jgi:hypothetical protein
MLVTLSFGDLETGTWGVVWKLDGDGFALLGDPITRGAEAVDATIDGSGSEDSWWLAGPGTELEVAPEGPPAELDGGFDQLVRVRGSWTKLDTEHEVECFGRRGTRESIDLQRFEAVRDVSAWFEPDFGMSVVAARPRGSGGHGEDVLSASVLEEGRPLRVTDPRLSTTYAGSGVPVRASFELWLERPPQEEQPEQQEGDDPVHSFPRRAAGEALEAQGSVSSGSLSAQAGLFRWHARGRDGAGVYVLARLAA